MKCPRCQNEEKRLFAYGSKGIYCRACIGFKRQLIEEEMIPKNTEIEVMEMDYELPFVLSKAQQEIGNQLKELIKKEDVLLYAVCGAGKTEMLLETLKDCFKTGRRAAIAIARRQVVLELAERLQEYFPKIKVTPIAQGYTDELEGDLIICTTHQLYRFYQAFDVLILDEPDAFPYFGNPVLMGIAASSCRGHRVYLTATPDAEMEKQVEEKKLVQLSLLKRPHGFLLPEPRLIFCAKATGWLHLWLWLKKRKPGRQALIFVPTIALAELLGRGLSLFFKAGWITSRSVDKEKIIQDFRQHRVQFLAATSILERGVTFAAVDVAVFWADHPVFNEAALVQMAGRAGRKKEDPYGEVIFISFSKKETVAKCLKRIQNANRSLSSV